ncbi:MAG: hypothetical protein D6693_01690 [Planctomycetota bacterium]|nr:MAG: hypothetical protein D6693_01690 [Planctomycetota bacterium]
MRQTILRWALLAVAVFAVGPALAWLTGLVGDGHGGRATTLFVSSTLPASAVLGLAAIAVAGGLGAAVRRATGAGFGLFCAGAALAWPAFVGATVEDAVRYAQSPRPLYLMTAEMVLVGLAGLAAARLIVGPVEPDPTGREEPEELIGSRAAAGAGVSLLTALVAAWVLAREGTPGQNLATAGLASMAAVAAGRSAAPKASIIACLAGVFVVGLAGPLAGALVHGSGIVEASYSNTLLPLARVTPMTWLAGGLLGAPMGAAWAASVMERAPADGPARA